jgi:PAS domain S-box-containing protein
VKLTEEVLDTLPVAVAVKDRNLDYVAVNQEFCRALGATRDTILGHRSWDTLSPDLAGKIEQMDWQLLSSGEPSFASIIHTRPDGESVTLERRALRLGKPGNPYIAVSLAGTLGCEAAADPLDAASAITAPDLAPAAQPVPLRNVLHLTHAANPSQALKLALRAHGVDLCQICDVPEFAAFLPAARAAGVRLDLVMIDFDFDPAAFNIAASSGTDFRMLPQSSGESTVMAEVLNALPDAAARSNEPASQPRRSEVQRDVMAPASRIDDAPAGLDVLAVEDNALNRMVLDQVLGGLGLNVKIAVTAGEALAACRAQSPRIVLADTTLPDQDTADFVLDLRRLDPSRPLVALVASDSREHHDHAQSIGFDESLSKPLSAEALTALLAKHLALPERLPFAAASPFA